MADPVTWTIISAGLAVAGGAVDAVGAISNAKHRNAELEANAQAADLNASIAAQNAAIEGRRRDRELAENRRKFNLLKGTTRAQSGALGIFGGSTLDVLADFDTQQIFEQTSIVDERTSAQQGNYYQSAAEKARASGLRGAQQSGTLGAIGSLLSGFGSAADIMSGLAGGGSSSGSTP